MLMKSLLNQYCIGQNNSLEQYEIKNQNTAEIINKLVTNHFNFLREANNQIGSMCSKEKINNYNKLMYDKITN